MDNEKLFELMTQMYTEMKEGFGKVDKRFGSVDKRLESTDKRLDSMDEKFESTDKRFESIDKQLSDIKDIVIKIEHEHGEKIDALFDGYIQNSNKLDRIEKEVSKHENFILKRIK